MKYTLDKLMEHPNYFHRVIGYAFRNSRFVDDFGISGETLGPDGMPYIRLDQIKSNPRAYIMPSGRRSNAMSIRYGVLGYVNDFEMVKRMYSQKASQPHTTPTWEEIDDMSSLTNEATFAECSDDFTKIMLFLNFKEREDFYRKYTQYKISIFGHRTKLSTEGRRMAVAKIKKESREYLDCLTREIYGDVFTLMVLCSQGLIAKDLDVGGRYTKFLNNNKDVAELWWQSGGQAYYEQYKLIEGEYLKKHNAVSTQEDFIRLKENEFKQKSWFNISYYKKIKMREAERLMPAFIRENNILYKLPQLNNVFQEAGESGEAGLVAIDYIPIFQTFIDNYRQDHIAQIAESEAGAVASK